MALAHVFQINISHGGVPKHAVREAVVGEMGIETDHQNDTVYHGGRDRALVVYSLERLLALQAEGHPIFAGSIGENVTISGLEWQELAPGTRLAIGEVAVEITGYASPCSKIRESFSDGFFNRIREEKYPGWSRLTLRVLRPGQISVGDIVIVEAAGDG